MDELYTPEELKKVAQRTAGSVGWEAVRWWFPGRDRARLCVESKRILSTGAEIVVVLEAPLA